MEVPHCEMRHLQHFFHPCCIKHLFPIVPEGYDF